MTAPGYKWAGGVIDAPDDDDPWRGAFVAARLPEGHVTDAALADAFDKAGGAFPVADTVAAMQYRDSHFGVTLVTDDGQGIDIIVPAKVAEELGRFLLGIPEDGRPAQ
jgi:hypothetical protein